MPTDDGALSLAIVVPCRNEASTVAGVLEALERVDYAGAPLSIVLVDDGSRDETRSLLERWAAAGPARHVVALDVPGGKVNAVEAGAAAVPDTELVGICDADLRPQPECWARMAVHFSNPEIAAVAGFLAPVNHDESVVSRYAATETWVHQLVTSLGKDALSLNPPTHGASIYRRRALAEIGGFKAGASGEDVTTTAALTAAGWTTRFARDAVIENRVVAGWREYWRQHVRWARGTLDVRKVERNGTQAGVLRRLEDLVASAGYLDRLALLAAVVLPQRRAQRWTLVFLYGTAALAEVCVALARGGVDPRRRTAYLGAIALVFPADVAATATAAAAQLRRRHHAWASPR